MNIPEVIVGTKWCNDDAEFNLQHFNHKQDYMVTEVQVVPCGTRDGFYAVVTFRYQYPGYTEDLKSEHGIEFQAE